MYTYIFEVLCVTSLEPSLRATVCPQSRLAFYCTTRGDELSWMLGSTLLYIFNSRNKIVQQSDTTSTYSLVLSEQNEERRSVLIFSEVPDSTFSVTCFNGSASTINTTTMDISSMCS